MASVRITQEIRDHVRNKIDKMFSPRINAKLAELQNPTLDVANQLYDAHITGEEQIAYRALKAAGGTRTWLQQVSHLNAKAIWTDDAGVNRSHTFQVALRDPRPCPMNWNSYGCILELPPTTTCYPKVAQILREHFELTQEQKQLQTTLSGLFNEATTLRQVLEVWPTALEFIPPAAVARHHEKAEPRAAVKEFAKIDEQTQALLIKTKFIDLSQGLK